MFWISVRDVAGGNFGEEPDDFGKTRYLKVPDGADPLPAHEIPRKKWVEEVLAHFPADAKGVRKGDIVVFVHGYNNTVSTVAKRQRLIADGLVKAGFPCLVISFDWPAGDSTLGYLEDRHDAKQTAMRLVKDGLKVFTAAQSKTCEINLHVIAHSMGAYLVREAFDDADDSKLAEINWTTSQVVFVAGDVSSPSLADGNSASVSLYRHTYRLTNYFSQMDEPLQVSAMKRVGLSPRVGRVGLPETAPAKALDVNCTGRYEVIAKNGPPGGMIGDPTHSWYFHDAKWMQDLAHTLAGKLDRNAIPTRTPSGAGDNDFMLKA